MNERCIMIASGSGGVGKTSLAAALARALAERGRRVLAADLNAGTGDLDLRLGAAQGAVFSIRDVLEAGLEADKAAAPAEGAENLFFLSASPAGYAPPGDALQNWVGRTLRTGWDIVLDCPTGVGPAAAAARAAANLALLLCPVSPSGIREAARTADFLAETPALPVRLAAARVPTDKRGQKALLCTVDDCMDACGLPLGAILWEDAAFAAASGARFSSLRSPAAEEIRALAGRIAGGEF